MDDRKRFEIRRAGEADREEIGRFLGLAYHPWGQFKYPERWQWQFVHNPFRPPGELPVWLAISEGAIVGQVANTHVRLKVGGQVVRAVNQSDLVVLPSHRRSGVARALMTASLEGVDGALNLWMSSTTEKILRTLGYVELPSISAFFHRPGEPEAWERKDARVAIERVRRFGPQVDALWDEIGSALGLAVVRDATYLNWKFADQPHAGYELFEAHRGGQLCGYAIGRQCAPPEPPLAIVADLIAAPGDGEALEALARFVRGHYRRRAILVATSMAEHQAALRQCGFEEQRREPPIRPFLWSRTRRLDPGEAGQNMLMSRGDSDWDQVPYAAIA
jgi:GNAT superfamily N-acetyltransferase